MCEIAIRVESLSKSYDIGLLKTQYQTLRDVLVDSFKSVLRRNRQTSEGSNSFWALQDALLRFRRAKPLG